MPDTICIEELLTRLRRVQNGSCADTEAQSVLAAALIVLVEREQTIQEDYEMRHGNILIGNPVTASSLDAFNFMDDVDRSMSWPDEDEVELLD